MKTNDVNKIVKNIITIINEKIPKKTERLERKYWIWIHTCNFTQKIKLANWETLSISINDYLDNNKDTNASHNSKWSTYDIFFWDDDGIYLVNSSNNYDSYSHDLEWNSEYFEVLEKICEIMNTKEEKESNWKSVSEILSKMK